MPATRSRRPNPIALARIASRSMCPTCDDREPAPGEEAYASCFFCAFAPDPGTDPPGEDETPGTPDAVTNQPAPN